MIIDSHINKKSLSTLAPAPLTKIQIYFELCIGYAHTDSHLFTMF